MPVEYTDLENLIFQSEEARKYYNELPEYIRNDIDRYPDKINTYEKLEEFADSLLRGND